jgi:hypothetical protein
MTSQQNQSGNLSLPFLPTMDDLYFPRTSSKPRILWISIIVLEVLLVGLFLVRLGNFMNTTYTHTYNLPVNSPGTLLSTRNSLYYWFNLVALAFQFLVLIVGAARISSFWNSFCSTLHSIFLVLSSLSEIGLFILLLVLISSCNSEANPLNPCNDDLYCCAYAKPNDFANTLTGCPTPTTTCSITIDPVNLGWNSVFAYHFGFVITSLVITLILTGIGLFTSFGLDDMFSKVELDTSTNTFVVLGNEEGSLKTNDNQSKLSFSTSSEQQKPKGSTVMQSNQDYKKTMLEQQSQKSSSSANLQPMIFSFQPLGIGEQPFKLQKSSYM